MNDKVRVLVVDDSAFARSTISKAIKSDSQMEVVGTARDGAEALEMVHKLKPQVVTLDVSMPRMDGLAALGRIMAECPTPVVMLSALTGENTEATIKALELGAVDFFLKSSPVNPTGNNGMASGLIDKVKIAARVSPSKLRARATSSRSNLPPRTMGRPSRVKQKVIVIGSSTGGPRALAELIPQLPTDIHASILLVQHMPAGFTHSLAKRLDQSSQIRVKEAEPGDRLEKTKALLAPGGYHMVVERSGEISLNQEELVRGVRPAVDVTMESVVKVYGNSSVGVVLTGMGTDGTTGTGLIKKAGGKVAVEHESTCAIYGMPRSVVEAGNTDIIVPLDKMADEIVRMCSQ